MVVEVVYVFIIPVWIILIVLMFAMGLWELLVCYPSRGQ